MRPVQKLLFGADHAAAVQAAYRDIQTIGGSGALESRCRSAQTLPRQRSGSATDLDNHRSIFEGRAGFPVSDYPLPRCRPPAACVRRTLALADHAGAERRAAAPVPQPDRCDLSQHQWQR